MDDYDIDAIIDGMAEDDVCEYVGHEWSNAGGGLLICTECFEEMWEPDSDGQVDYYGSPG